MSKLSLYLQTMFWKKKQKLILQYASRRGGSTLLAQVLATEKGVGFVDQPFDLWKPESKRGVIIKEHLPDKAMSQFFELSTDERQQIKYYLNKIYKHQLTSLSSEKKAKQYVLKIVNAHGLIDELPTMVPSQTVALVRHPCSQALSVVRNKWGTCEEPFLRSEKWSSTYLSAEQIKVGLSVSQNGTYLEKAILNWCLEWHYPLKHAKSNFLLLHYEKMILDPVGFVDQLFDYVGYVQKNKAVEVISKPSQSSAFSSQETLEKIKSGAKETLLSSWRNKMTADEMSAAQRLLDVFEVTAYSTNSDIPLD